MSLSQLGPRVRANVRDGGGVLADPADYDAVLLEAVRRYSRAKPRRVVADVAGSGAFDYPLPAGWDAQWSRLERVEYPAGRREPVYVDRLDWTLYDAPQGPVLRFRADTPQVGETIRLTFTGLHTLEELATSVPPADHDALVLLASALACEQLASHYTNAGDSTIQADAVDHKSKAAEYALRAKRFMQLANELLPVAEQGEVRPAGGETSWGEEIGLLTHPQR